MLAFVGVGGGFALGEMAAGTRLRAGVDGPASYSHLSANPDAMVQSAEGTILPCPGCADSYGVAARLRAERDHRMSDEFRELGAVDVDSAVPDDPVDDYRYGGRFPDPESGAAGVAAQRDAAPSALPASANPPADTMVSSTAEN